MYREINIRLAQTNITKTFIALLKLFKQLSLLSHYIYDFHIFTFEKLSVFFIKDIESFSFFAFLPPRSVLNNLLYPQFLLLMLVSLVLSPRVTFFVIFLVILGS